MCSGCLARVPPAGRKRFALFLKMLPLVFHALHKPLETLLAADVLQEGVVLVDEGIIDEAPIDGVFEPVQRLVFFAEHSERSRDVI